MFKERPLCDTRIRNGLLEIKVPLVFFKDSKFRNVVGYSPGFGRVGCFVHNEFDKERIYMIWITYMEFFPSPSFQAIMEKFDVKWVVGEHPNPSMYMQGSETLSLVSSGNLKGMETAKGLIVAIDNENNACQIYCPEFGLCQYPLLNDSQLKLGSFVKFFTLQNFSGKTVPIHVYCVNSIAKGIVLVATKPQIKLSIYKWEFINSEQVISVPGWNLKMKTEEGTSDWWSMRSGSDKPLEVDYNEEEQRFKARSPNVIKVCNAAQPADMVEAKAERQSISPVESSTPIKSLNSSSLNNTSSPETMECSKSTENSTSVQDDEIKTDAVVVYIKESTITLYAIKTKLSNPKFYTDRYRFQTDPKLGEWYHVNLRFKIGDRVFMTKATHLSTPTLQTAICENSLLKLFTSVKITNIANTPQDDPDQIVGYSEELGPIIDNTKSLKRSDMGKMMSIWVLSTSYKNGAHWRIYASGLRPIKKFK
uniref:Uncharacterized protein n=1 Tax=Ditylenchus dipsaci TaxID=166011 RepID=A0A915CXZ6_9BILA